MLHYAVSGDAPAGLYLQPKPASSKLLDGLIDPDPLPRWLTAEDLDVYCDAYGDGFRGPINWYRSYRSGEVTHGLEHANDVVIDGDLIAANGAMLTLQLTQRTLSSVPVGLFLRFRDGRMTSEVVFICGSAETIDVSTEEVPSVDVLRAGLAS